MAIGDKILELRKSKNMTQRELAEKLNVSDNVISRWETGKTRPDVDMMKTISDVLDVPIQELYDSIDPTVVNNIEKYDNDAIFKFKKYVIFGIFIIIFSYFIFAFNRKIYKNLLIKDTVESLQVLFPSKMLFIGTFLSGIALCTVEFVYLFDIQRRMFYKKEYRRVMLIYGIIVITVLIVVISLFITDNVRYKMLR